MSAEKWGLALEQEDLGLAKSAGNAHGKLHHPIAPAFTITSKMKLVPASMELDILDGVSLRRYRRAGPNPLRNAEVPGSNIATS